MELERPRQSQFQDAITLDIGLNLKHPVQNITETTGSTLCVLRITRP